jgi:hypothetical protein
MRWVVAIWLALLWSAHAEPSRVTLEVDTQPVRLGFVSAPMVVTLQGTDGGAERSDGGIPFTVQSSSPQGEFSASSDPTGIFTTTYMGTITPGSWTSNPLYYRDGASGTPSLSLDAGPALIGDLRTQLISNDSLVDDMESGTLTLTDLPPGRWNAIHQGGTTDRMMRPDPAAAHRGAWGARFVATMPGPNTAYVAAFTGPIAPQFYARCWLRPTLMGGAPNVNLVNIGANGSALIDVNLRGASFESLFVGGFDRFGVYWHDGTDAGMSLETWHLAEFALNGLSTTSGRRRVWVDGALVHDRPSIDYQGVTAYSFEVGLPYQNVGQDSFVGALDLDDCRSSHLPLAERLEVDLAGPLVAGACASAEVTLVDPEGAPAIAPYLVDAGLDVTGVSGGFFDDARCSRPVTSVGIRPTLSQQQVFFQATSVGVASISASHRDFLNATTSVFVDAGLEPSLDVRCGCGASGAQALLILGALPLARRRRR